MRAELISFTRGKCVFVLDYLGARTGQVSRRLIYYRSADAIVLTVKAGDIKSPEGPSPDDDIIINVLEVDGSQGLGEGGPDLEHVLEGYLPRVLLTELRGLDR
jgi:hypothetical protein